MNALLFLLLTFKVSLFLLGIVASVFALFNTINVARWQQWFCNVLCDRGSEGRWVEGRSESCRTAA